MLLKNTLIQRKLTIVLFMVSGTVLLLTCAAFSAYEIVTLRKGLVDGYTTRASIIAANSTAALAFQNESDAEDVLGALKTDKRIIEACLYDSRGKVFAKYPADAQTGLFPAGPGESAYRNGHLDIFCPIVQGDRTLGAVYLQSDLSALTDRYRAYAWLAAAIIAGSLLVAYLLSGMLQNQISAPILALAETAEAISKHRDFSVRAQKFGEDELGLLTDAFNRMLGEILAQDQALKASEANYREIFDKANDAIYIHDPETGRVLDVNEKTCELLECAREDVLEGDPSLFLTGLPGYALPDAVRWIRKAAQEGPQLFEWRGRTKKGGDLYLEISLKKTVLAGQDRVLALVRDISERRRMSKTIEEKTRLLSSIMQNMSEGIAVAGLDGKMLYFNDGLERITGMRMSSNAPSEWAKEFGVYMEDMKTPFPTEKNPLVLAIQGEESNAVIQFLRNANHTGGIFVSVNGRPLRDEKGSLVGGLVVVRDITEQRKITEALKASEANYREIFDKANDGIIITDPEASANPIVDMNAKLEKMTGFTLEEYQKVPAEKLFSNKPGSTAVDYGHLAAKALSQGPQLFEWEALHKDGHTYWIEVSLQKAILAGKTRLIAFMRDISERKKLEEVTKAQDFVSMVLENVPNMIFVKDAKDLRFVMFNKAGEELLGISKADLIGKNDYDFFSKKEADFFTEKDRKTLEGKKLLDIREEPIQTKDKGTRTLHTKKIPVLDKDGKPLYLMGISEDITEQKQQEKLKIYTQALEASNRDLQDFIFVASHDLQEPLRKIQSFGNFLAEEAGSALSETALSYLSRMRDGAGRMSLLIEDLLELTRVTTRGKPFVEVDLKEVLGEVLSDLEMKLKETGGSVESGELPRLEADPTQMRQLFQNLISNSLKFRKNGQAPVIQITAQKDPQGEVLLRLKDNGIGFDPKYAGKIFNIFQRLHGRDEYEGTGIGLAICRKVVERHGGTIKADSQLGQGAVFEISLPLKQIRPGGTES